MKALKRIEVADTKRRILQFNFHLLQVIRDPGALINRPIVLELVAKGIQYLFLSEICIRHVSQPVRELFKHDSHCDGLVPIRPTG